MLAKDVEIGMYVSAEGYDGIAFWIDRWSTTHKMDYFEHFDEESGEAYYGWEEVEIDSDYMVMCYMVGDDRVHPFDIAFLTPISDDDFCVSCGQIGCGHG